MFNRKLLAGVMVLAAFLICTCSDDESSTPTEPSEPFQGFRFVSQYKTFDHAYGVTVSGSYAYVADHDSGMHIVDVSHPASPVRVGRYQCPGALQVDLKGGLAFIADETMYSLEIVDVSNPSNPTLVGRFDTLEVLGVRVYGNYALMGCGSDGLVVVDVSNPANPVLAGCCQELGPLRFELSGSYALVPAANGMDGLHIASLMDPVHPVVVSTIATKENPYEVASKLDYAYVTCLGSFSGMDTGHLYIIDISSKTSPQLLDSLFVGDATVADYVYGDQLFVSYANRDKTTGFQIFDITNPAEPVKLKDEGLESLPWDIWVEGEYAYVAADTAGLLIYQFGF
jgi:hypothetical protein